MVLALYFKEVYFIELKCYIILEKSYIIHILYDKLIVIINPTYALLEW